MAKLPQHVTSNKLQTAGLNRQGKHLGTLGGSSGKPEQWLSFDMDAVKADCRRAKAFSVG